MENTSSTGYAKDSSDELTRQFRERISKKYQNIKGNPLIEWFCWNGAYIYAYGCSLGGIICALVSPLTDMLYQGDNKFPYVSEVIRSGFPQLCFIVGCSVGFIPTLFFSLNYLITSFDYNHLLKKMRKRLLYDFWNLIIYLGFVYSAISVIGVSLCDMDHYPDMHTVWSFSWVIITNIMEMIQFIIVRNSLYTDERYDRKYICSKLAFLLLSIFGMLNFAILGSYVPCHSHHVSMETCLEEFSEEFCFSNQLEEYPNLIYYRYYGHCPILHYIRGVGEFLAVVSTMFYLTTMVYDLKLMRSILIEKADLSNSVGIYDDGIEAIE